LEISGVSPYLTAQVPEDQETATNVREAGTPPKTAASQESPAGDRVELVRAQNQASPLPEDLDLKKAVILLGQVEHQLNLLARQDLRQLYQFDRLRELCCRLYGPAES